MLHVHCTFFYTHDDNFTTVHIYSHLKIFFAFFPRASLNDHLKNTVWYYVIQLLTIFQLLRISMVFQRSTIFSLNPIPGKIKQKKKIVRCRTNERKHFFSNFNRNLYAHLIAHKFCELMNHNHKILRHLIPSATNPGSMCWC